MRISALKYTVLSWICVFVMVVICLVPFQGFLTVWASHMFGHYTAFRLWDEVLLLFCIIGAIYLFLTDRKIRSNTLSRRLVWVILAYITLNLLWGLISYTDHMVTAKALGYGLIVNLRYPIFFLITWSVALRLPNLRNRWLKLVIWPAAIVIFFGLLEIFILPNDFLKHFGYGPHTIPAVETVNSNRKYVRIPSTLRGANPLGAYLIIPITLMSFLILKGRRSKKNLAFLIGGLIVLFFSYSRSAWLGTILSLVILLFASKLSKKYQKVSLGIAGGLVISAIIAFVALHNNHSFQNFVFHTQSNSSIKTTSDQNHLNDLKNGLIDVANHPLGKGPGTAGPASIYSHNPRIAENYYIQIGQEVGWLGLLLFLLINVGVGYLLWLRRGDPLALGLFASLIGISFANLFLYAWSDDTLSYIWWGLAGIAMAPVISYDSKEKNAKSNA